MNATRRALALTLCVGCLGCQPTDETGGAPPATSSPTSTPATVDPRAEERKDVELVGYHRAMLSASSHARLTRC